MSPKATNTDSLVANIKKAAGIDKLDKDISKLEEQLKEAQGKRTEALRAVSKALGTQFALPVNGHGTKAKTVKNGRSARRTSEEVLAATHTTASDIVTYLKGKGATSKATSKEERQLADTIAESLGLKAADLTPALRMLLKKKTIKKFGKARGTEYCLA